MGPCIAPHQHDLHSPVLSFHLIGLGKCVSVALSYSIDLSVPIVARLLSTIGSALPS